MKLLKFELLKTIRNKFIVFVVLALLIANGVTAFYLCKPENDAATENYASAIGDLLADTEKKYSMLEDKDSFTGEYYTQIKDMYSALDTDVAPRQVSGWGQYLCYGFVNLFLLMATRPRSASDVIPTYGGIVYVAGKTSSSYSSTYNCRLVEIDPDTLMPIHTTYFSNVASDCTTRSWYPENY